MYYYYYYYYYYYLIQFYAPFQYYFCLYEAAQSVGGTKTGEPRGKKQQLAHRQAELGIS